jgi:pyruvate-formate lyase-activating enzyme
MSLSPVYGVLQNASMVDYPGKLAAVFFLTGCNFKCGFCHNAALMGRVDAAGLPWTESNRSAANSATTGWTALSSPRRTHAESRRFPGREKNCASGVSRSSWITKVRARGFWKSCYRR